MAIDQGVRENPFSKMVSEQGESPFRKEAMNHVHTYPSGYSGGFGIPMPEGEPCEGCGERPGRPHQCPADGAAHGHGMIHTKEHHLRWVCCECLDRELAPKTEPELFFSHRTHQWEER